MTSMIRCRTTSQKKRRRSSKASSHFGEVLKLLVQQETDLTAIFGAFIYFTAYHGNAGYLSYHRGTLIGVAPVIRAKSRIIRHYGTCEAMKAARHRASLALRNFKVSPSQGAGSGLAVRHGGKGSVALRPAILIALLFKDPVDAVAVMATRCDYRRNSPGFGPATKSLRMNAELLSDYGRTDVS